MNWHDWTWQVARLRPSRDIYAYQRMEDSMDKAIDDASTTTSLPNASWCQTPMPIHVLNIHIVCFIVSLDYYAILRLTWSHGSDKLMVKPYSLTTSNSVYSYQNSPLRCNWHCHRVLVADTLQRVRKWLSSCRSRLLHSWGIEWVLLIDRRRKRFMKVREKAGVVYIYIYIYIYIPES